MGHFLYFEFTSIIVFLAYQLTVDLLCFHTEMPDRSGGSTTLLPVSVKDKESRSKEELHKLLNGNSVDSADRV